MANKATTRYTINLDWTVEKWFLEKDCGERVWLRRTPAPKFNCGMRDFDPSEVFTSRTDTTREIKRRLAAADAGKGENHVD